MAACYPLRNSREQTWGRMARKPQQPKQPKRESRSVEVYAPDEPTPEQIKTAEALAAHGISNADIGVYLEKPEEWVNEKLGAVIRRSRVRFNVKLVQTVTEVAFGREKKTQPVTKTRINARGKEVEYTGYETIQEARPPNPQMLLYLAKERLGWRDPGAVRQPEDDGKPQLNLTESLDYERLSDAEVEALDRILQKSGYQPSAPAKSA